MSDYTKRTPQPQRARTQVSPISTSRGNLDTKQKFVVIANSAGLAYGIFIAGRRMPGGL